MLVYRYENEAGHGPFTFDNYKKTTEDEDELQDILNDKVDFIIHPTPRLSLYSGPMEDYFFGCDSIEQLNVWFDEEIRYYLNLCGFELKVYDCPDEFCVVDNNQVGFLMEEAEQLELVND